MEENNIFIKEKNLSNDKIINNELLEQKSQNKKISNQKLFFFIYRKIIN